MPYILIVTLLATGIFAPVFSSPVLAQDPPPTDTNAGCGWSNFWTMPCLIMGVGAKIVTAIMWIFSIALFLAGKILDLSVKYTLTDMTALVNNVSIVNIGWTVFRDLANIFFIFLILWLAISTILGLSGGTMKTLLRIILAAVLINFSLFITKAVIDAGNIIALHFYTLITGEGGSLSGVFMSGLKLSTIYNADAIGALTGSKLIIVGVFGSILILVAAWVFLAAALMFVYRAITLIVLMILSPLAFVSWVIPGLSKHTGAWWDKLFKQTFFAPIFMVMTFVVGKALQSGASFSRAQSNNLAVTLNDLNSVAQNPDSAGVFINFILLIGMLVAALIVANSLGARGATTMMAWGKAIQGAGTGIIGRNLAGRGAQAIADTEAFKRFASRNPRLGSTMFSGLGKISGARFGGARGGFTAQQERAKQRKINLGKHLAEGPGDLPTPGEPAAPPAAGPAAGVPGGPTGAAGGSVSAQRTTYGPAGSPTISSFTATPGIIRVGDSSMLNWDVAGATLVELDQGIGGVAALGSMQVFPTGTAQYTLNAQNNSGNTTANLTITVQPPPSAPTGAGAPPTGPSVPPPSPASPPGRQAPISPPSPAPKPPPSKEDILRGLMGDNFYRDSNFHFRTFLWNLYARGENHKLLKEIIKKAKGETDGKKDLKSEVKDMVERIEDGKRVDDIEEDIKKIREKLRAEPNDKLEKQIKEAIEKSSYSDTEKQRLRDAIK